MRAFRFFIAPSALIAILLASTVTGAPPANDPNQTGLVEGYVVGLDGNPVAGARVQIMAARSGEVISEFETGRAGTFQLRLWAGDYEARAGKQVFPSAAKMFTVHGGATHRLKLILRERAIPSTGVLVFGVSNSNGEPIVGAWARVYSAETGEGVTRFTTNEHGSWMQELKPGKYYLEAGSNEFETAWRAFVIEPGRLTDVKIVLKEWSAVAMGVLAGYVCTEQGDMIGRVPTFVFSNDTGEVVSRFVSDEGGVFRLQLKPGKYNLKTLSAGYISGGAEFEIHADRTTELKVVLTPVG